MSLAPNGTFKWAVRLGTAKSPITGWLVFATEATMHGIIYLVGLIVVILAILSFFGLR